MGLFMKDKKNNVYNYLEEIIDKSEIKATCENKANEIRFMKLALQIVATYISSAISICEFKIYDKKEEKKDITYYKLNINPNPNETATRLKYQFTKDLIEKGEALVVKYKNYLYYAEDFNLDDDSILGYKFGNIVIQDKTIDRKFDKKTSFYFKLDDDKILNTLKSINLEFDSLINDAVTVFKKAIDNKWKIKIDAMKENEIDFTEKYEKFVNKQLKEFLSTPNAVYPELNGYNLEHIKLGDGKSDYSDIKNIRKDIFDLVAQTFKMPTSMMYGNISNLKEVVNQFITFTIKPIAKMIGEELTKTFYSEEEVLNGKHIEVDISTINYKDFFDIATGVEKLISNGVSNIDEVRAILNLPELGTEFSKQHWITKNYEKIEDALINDFNGDSNIADNTLKGGDDIDEK